jgi:hypothetical protein
MTATGVESMNPRYPLVVGAALFSIAVAEAGFPSPKFKITLRDSKERTVFLAVVNGKLNAVPNPAKAATGKGKTSAVWYIDGTRLKSASGCGYLAYDLSGKDSRVFLVPKPGGNTEWKVTDIEKHGKSHTPGDIVGWHAYFQVGKGKYTGRYLSLEEDRPMAKGRQRNRPVYRAIVSSDESRPHAGAWRPVVHP